MKLKAGYLGAIVSCALILHSCNEGGGDGSGGSGCTQIGGSWAVSDSASVTCTGIFGSGTRNQSGSGAITITQSGCDIHYRMIDNTLRTGSIDGNSIHLTGIVAEAGRGITLDKNRIDFYGTISADGQSIDLTGTGSVTGSIQGRSGSCSVHSTEHFQKK